MTKPEPPFDSEAYANYRKLLKEKKSKNINQSIANIIDQLDMIIEQLEEEEDE